jgi:hypothetical protein
MRQAELLMLEIVTLLMSGRLHAICGVAHSGAEDGRRMNADTATRRTVAVGISGVHAKSALQHATLRPFMASRFGNTNCSMDVKLGAGRGQMRVLTIRLPN